MINDHLYQGLLVIQWALDTQVNEYKIKFYRQSGANCTILPFFLFLIVFRIRIVFSVFIAKASFLW